MSKKKGVTFDEFHKDYLPKLRRLREKEPRLKIFGNNNNQKEVIYWELSL